VVLPEARISWQEKVLVLIWDNASWHISCEVRRWIGERNREVKKNGSEAGVRIVTCLLPKKSPWLNAMEPKWIHGKRKVVEPDGLLGAHELAERVCAAFDCPHYEHIYPLPKMSPERALDSLCKKSRRRLRIFACTTATSRRALVRRFDPFFARLRRRCLRRSFFCNLW
jgi:hypothetical protein